MCFSLWAARQYAKTNLLPERVLCFYYKALESYAKRQIGTPNIKEDMIWVPPHQLPKYNTCGSPDPQSLLGDYPVVPLHPSSEEAILSQADKVSWTRPVDALLCSFCVVACAVSMNPVLAYSHASDYGITKLNEVA